MNPSPQSDAVEFAELLRCNCERSDDPKCIYVYKKMHYDSVEPLYAEFLNQKQK